MKKYKDKFDLRRLTWGIILIILFILILLSFLPIKSILRSNWEILITIGLLALLAKYLVDEVKYWFEI